MAWDDILGQALAKDLLHAHLVSGRVAPAYLLIGPEGVGKRRLALEFAKALNCTGGTPQPCDACAACGQMGRLAHPDLHVLAPGGASEQIKIETIRQLIGRLSLRPYNAAVQVAIIDGAERLTEEAANSLLKILEEPPARTRFLLTTAARSACLPTIVSRCQLVRCQPLSVEIVRQIVMREAGVEPAAAETIARLAGGSAARALELAGRWAARAALAARAASADPVAWFEPPLPESREDVTALVEGLLEWVRDLACTTVELPEQVAHAQHAPALRRQARGLDPGRCVAVGLKLLALRESLDQFVSPRLVAGLAREQWLSLTTVSC